MSRSSRARLRQLEKIDDDLSRIAVKATKAGENWLAVELARIRDELGKKSQGLESQLRKK